MFIRTRSLVYDHSVQYAGNALFEPFATATAWQITLPATKQTKSLTNVSWRAVAVNKCMQKQPPAILTAMNSILMATTLSPQDVRRVFLAAILPLYMRHTTFLRIVCAVGVAVAAVCVSIGLGKKEKAFERELIVPLVVAAAWSFISARLADYLLAGGWQRLLLTYVIAFDSLFDLLPDALMPDLEADLLSLRSRSCQQNDPLTFNLPIICAAAVSSMLVPQYHARSAGKLVLCTTVVFACSAVISQRGVALVLWGDRRAEGFTKRDDVKKKAVSDKATNTDGEMAQDCGTETRRSSHHRRKPSSSSKEARRPEVMDDADSSTGNALKSSPPPPPPLPVITVTDLDPLPWTDKPTSMSPAGKRSGTTNVWNRKANPTYDPRNLYPVDHRSKLRAEQRRHEKERKLRKEREREAKQVEEEQANMVKEKAARRERKSKEQDREVKVKEANAKVKEDEQIKRLKYDATRKEKKEKEEGSPGKSKLWVSFLGRKSVDECIPSPETKRSKDTIRTRRAELKVRYGDALNRARRGGQGGVLKGVVKEIGELGVESEKEAPREVGGSRKGMEVSRTMLTKTIIDWDAGWDPSSYRQGDGEGEARLK
ncbi:hypothetical protein CC80DRAFT_576933 [Byssothecium circinans]|uniref:Uncharacterized protein n=1 Tax=Byssothecium circinans TaxID=147558 RepID=A0A6A5TES4_9PLEO|nr:hypothetical protein CC80DRAFT_576933 [Byssothecium circinans]